MEVDSDGDVVVRVGTGFWLFNPSALEGSGKKLM